MDKFTRPADHISQGLILFVDRKIMTQPGVHEVRYVFDIRGGHENSVSQIAGIHELAAGGAVAIQLCQVNSVDNRGQQVRMLGVELVMSSEQVAGDQGFVFGILSLDVFGTNGSP